MTNVYSPRREKVEINPWQILWQIINFSILVWLIGKFVAKPLNNFLEKRQADIKTSLEDADEKFKESEALLAEQKETTKNAYQEAKAIRQNAEEAAKREQEIMVKQAKDEAKNIVENAHKDIAANYINAKKVLKTYAGELAINLSERIVKKEMDKETQRALVEEYINSSKN